MKRIIALTLLVITLNAYKAIACVGPVGSVAKIVCLADSLKSTLTSTQIASLQLSYSYANGQVWSNLPTTMQTRLGISLGSLNTQQLSIAKLLIKEISGTTQAEGYEEFEQLLLADEYLKNNGGGASYGQGLYYLCFNGTPSLLDAFSIKLGGHHLHIENTYNKGVMVGGTPHFEAIEPLTFTSGNTYMPINEEKVALSAMLNSLNATDLITAKLSTSFTDILMGAKNNGASKDWTFPSTKLGLKVATLSTTQKSLVLDAIKTYVKDLNDSDADAIIKQYSNELDETYIAYSGGTSLTTKNDYVRIDGPNVWIEFSVQNGIVMAGVHYHSIWRDHTRDYGGAGSAAGLQTTQIGSSTSTALNNIENIASDVRIYPNPSNDFLTIIFNLNYEAILTVNLTDLSGRVIKNILKTDGSTGEQSIITDLSALQKGIYFIQLKTDNSQKTYKVIKD